MGTKLASFHFHSAALKVAGALKLSGHIKTPHQRNLLSMEQHKTLEGGGYNERVHKVSYHSARGMYLPDFR